jgi:hypothetical protein
LSFDKARFETWKGDMEGILIFVRTSTTLSVVETVCSLQSGLFSASVTAFIIESYKNLKPDSGEATVALLAHISQQLAAASNGSHINAFPSHNSFQPTSSTLRVNTFWFLSLTFSLTCALAATLVEQWARHYLREIENHDLAPRKQGA